MSQFATRTEVHSLCREVMYRVEGCRHVKSATLQYVRLDRPGQSPETLIQWRKLTRKRATQVQMDSRLFEREV